MAETSSRSLRMTLTTYARSRSSGISLLLYIFTSFSSQYFCALYSCWMWLIREHSHIWLLLAFRFKVINPWFITCYDVIHYSGSYHIFWVFLCIIWQAPFWASVKLWGIQFSNAKMIKIVLIYVILMSRDAFMSL